MTGLLLAACSAAGTYLLYTAVVFGRRDIELTWWRHHGSGPRRRSRAAPGLGPPGPRAAGPGPWRARVAWAGLAGLAAPAGTRVGELVLASGVLAVVGGLAGMAVFGGPLAAATVALGAGAAPPASSRIRHQRARATAREAWPALIEEIRVLVGGLGRSVPQALLDAGTRAPVELRPAFDAARREWALTTDFERTVAVLKAQLADPTADAACETLLVAHEVGGTDLDRRLAALVEDRTLDVQGRKDARAEQAGVRFARRFVLLVPGGMALAGTAIGNGRAAYATPWGQAMVALGVAVVAVCWVWAGRLLRLPEEERVFR